jgi:hypothetical protein
MGRVSILVGCGRWVGLWAVERRTFYVWSRATLSTFGARAGGEGPSAIAPRRAGPRSGKRGYYEGKFPNGCRFCFRLRCLDEMLLPSIW